MIFNKGGGESFPALLLILERKSLVFIIKFEGFPRGSDGKESPCNAQEIQVLSLGWEDPLEKGMATHSSILSWRIPWTEEPGGLQSVELQRVRHN